jgi:hypothetical protein
MLVQSSWYVRKIGISAPRQHQRSTLAGVEEATAADKGRQLQSLQGLLSPNIEDGFPIFLIQRTAAKNGHQIRTR